MESASNQTAATRHNIQDANAAPTAPNNDDERRPGQYTSINDSTSGASSGAAGTATATMVITQQQQQSETNDVGPILRLSLRPQPNVTWDQNVINNEGLGRKSSKRCCIFHKQRAFGESSTESSEEDGDDDDNNSTSSSSSGGGGSGRAQRPIAKKKKKKMGRVGKPKVPDYQRFHA
jgi:protein phosphatase 1 regulatory subunit 11